MQSVGRGSVMGGGRSRGSPPGLLASQPSGPGPRSRSPEEVTRGGRTDHNSPASASQQQRLSRILQDAVQTVLQDEQGRRPGAGDAAPRVT